MCSRAIIQVTNAGQSLAKVCMAGQALGGQAGVEASQGPHEQQLTEQHDVSLGVDAQQDVLVP
jgi:hypothetical protein